MAKMHDHFGGVDILVNNAGCQFVSPVHEFPEDKVCDHQPHTTAVIHFILKIIPGDRLTHQDVVAVDLSRLT